MIDHEWCREIDPDDRDDLLSLLESAADYDAEAGFSAVPASAVDMRTTEDAQVWHLPVQARRDLSVSEDAPVEIIAYLNLSIDPDGQGTVQYVVRPEYRSRGVSTLLVEEIGLDASAPGGWCGTGAVALRSWAYGNHPAAERLTMRFDIGAAGRLWSVARALSGPFAEPIEPAKAPTGHRMIGPTEVNGTTRAQAKAVLDRATLTAHQKSQLADELGREGGTLIVAVDSNDNASGFVWFDPDHHDHEGLRANWIHALVVADSARGTGLDRALISEALEKLSADRSQVALMRVDPDNDDAVRLLRLMSFEQEESHACYQVGSWNEAARFRGR